MIEIPLGPAAARHPTALESCLSGLLRLLPLKHSAHRILDRLQPAAWSRDSHLVDVPWHGRVIRMDVSDLVGWHFLMLRNFDPEVTEVLERFGTGDEWDVFWDVGANKGACSYAIAVALPRARIVAIEPQQGMQALLEHNLRVLAPARHELFAVALGEAPGVAQLVVPVGNRGAATLRGHPCREGAHRVEQVRVTTASLLRERSRHGWPTLVKVAVEGYESRVVRSLAPAFADGSIRCCVFECRPTDAAGFRRIIACAVPHGYRIHAIRKSPFAPRLVPTVEMLEGCTDYAIVRTDLC